MSGRRLAPWLIAAGVAVLLAATGGYLIGSGAAIGESDADRARDEAFRAAHDRAEEAARKVTVRRGRVTGLKRGQAAGERVGTREGMGLGGGAAAVQLAEGEAAASRAAAAAARSEISARQANCGAVARAPGWCPTADELASFRAAVQAAREARAQERDERRGGGREDDED